MIPWLFGDLWLLRYYTPACHFVPLKASPLIEHGGTLTNSTLTRSPTHSLAAISACKNIQPSHLQPDSQALSCWLRDHQRNGMLPIPKGAEIEINSCGAPQHYRGMSPSEEPSDTSGQKSNLLPCCSSRGTREKDIRRSLTTGKRRSWHKLSPNSKGGTGAGYLQSTILAQAVSLNSGRRAPTKTLAMLRREMYVARIKSTQGNINSYRHCKQCESVCLWGALSSAKAMPKEA